MLQAICWCSAARCVATAWVLEVVWSLGRVRVSALLVLCHPARVEGGLAKGPCTSITWALYCVGSCCRAIALVGSSFHAHTHTICSPCCASRLGTQMSLLPINRLPVSFKMVLPHRRHPRGCLSISSVIQLCLTLVIQQQVVGSMAVGKYL